MGKNTKMVTITQSEYAKLLEDSQKLNCLENAGVDNWEWYGEAMSAMDSDEEKIDD